MGKIVTPAYRVELRCRGCQHTPAAWRVKGKYGVRGSGTPNLKNLHEWVVGLELSCLPDGVNKAVFFNYGYCPILSARIIRQSDGEIMAEWDRETHRQLNGDTRLVEVERKYNHLFMVVN